MRETRSLMDKNEANVFISPGRYYQSDAKIWILSERRKFLNPKLLCFTLYFDI